MKSNHEDIKQTFFNDFYKGVFAGLAIFFLIIIAFFLGIKIGQRNFNPRSIPPVFHPFLKPPREDFIPKRIRGHGVFGVIDSVSKESFIVKSRWGELITILVDQNTQYRVDNKKGSFSDIKKGRNVFIIGEPNNKEIAIKAFIIRIF